MTDSLLDKLQTLETTLSEVRKRYQANHNELKAIKSKPQVDIGQFNALKVQLAESNNARRTQIEKSETQQAQITKLTEKLAEMDEQYQTLAQAHHELNDRYTALEKKYAALEQTNHQLQEKNRIALQNTKIVSERLRCIDQGIS